MAEPTETTSVINSRRTIQESIALICCNTGSMLQMDQRAEQRTILMHQVRYCLRSPLSEDDTEPAFIIDISPGGIALWCCQTITPGRVVHIRLPLVGGKASWVRGKVMYCIPDADHYRAGIAFILDDDQS